MRKASDSCFRYDRHNGCLHLHPYKDAPEKPGSKSGWIQRVKDRVNRIALSGLP